MLAAFDQSWMDAFSFVYDPLVNQRMKWEWSGPARIIDVDSTTVKKYAVNLLTAQIQEFNPGKITISLDGVGCGIWIITDEEATADSIANEALQMLPYFDGTFATTFFPEAVLK
ncbi:hypothetical protein D3C86_1925760 [compost metagenome]